MDSIQVDGVTYWLPATTADVGTLIANAKATNSIICLRGSAHSFPLIKTLEAGPTSGRKYTYVMLSHLNGVSFTARTAEYPYGTVTAQGGCHLGWDPWDPTGVSTNDNSLLAQMDAKGYGLPDLGGISHQTVGGFLSTSSSGGSTQFAFEEALLSIQIMCYGANGVETKTFNMPANGDLNDPFYGAGVATMGLFGVIISATFKCSQRFFIQGTESTQTEANCEIDLFGDGSKGKPSYQQFLEQKQTDPVDKDTVHFPYSRMCWWPQPGLQATVLWKAQKTDEASAVAYAANAYQNYNGPPKYYPAVKPPFPELKPYEEVQWVDGSPTLMTLGADIMMSAIGNWPNWLLDTMGNTDEYKVIKGSMDLLFYPLIFPWIFNELFINIGGKDKPGMIQYFSDVWYLGLPMDNQMSDKLMPVWFTELWIPIDKAQNVMNDLKTYYAGGCQNAGFFCVEIYAAKNSNFWLCPAYKTDVIRIDVFWFGNNAGDPVAFYQGFWTLLQKYNFRPHWGKYLPPSSGPQGVSYLKSNYPMWNNWMSLRTQMDPFNLFLNDYWSDHLGIPNT